VCLGCAAPPERMVAENGDCGEVACTDCGKVAPPILNDAYMHGGDELDRIKEGGVVYTDFKNAESGDAVLHTGCKKSEIAFCNLEDSELVWRMHRRKDFEDKYARIVRDLVIEIRRVRHLHFRKETVEGDEEEIATDEFSDFLGKEILSVIGDMYVAGFTNVAKSKLTNVVVATMFASRARNGIFSDYVVDESMVLRAGEAVAVNLRSQYAAVGSLSSSASKEMKEYIIDKDMLEVVLTKIVCTRLSQKETSSEWKKYTAVLPPVAYGQPHASVLEVKSNAIVSMVARLIQKSATGEEIGPQRQQSWSVLPHVALTFSILTRTDFFAYPHKFMMNVFFCIHLVESGSMRLASYPAIHDSEKFLKIFGQAHDWRRKVYATGGGREETPIGNRINFLSIAANAMSCVGGLCTRTIKAELVSASLARFFTVAIKAYDSILAAIPAEDSETAKRFADVNHAAAFALAVIAASRRDDSEVDVAIGTKMAMFSSSRGALPSRLVNMIETAIAASVESVASMEFPPFPSVDELERERQGRTPPSAMVVGACRDDDDLDDEDVDEGAAAGVPQPEKEKKSKKRKRETQRAPLTLPPSAI